MKILLTGASGFIGRNLMAALSRDAHQVIPVSRRHGTDVTGLQTADAWLPQLDAIDAVINAVGIIGETRAQRFDTLHAVVPRALFDACQRAGVTRVIQISALGADETAFSAYHLSKKAADDHLRRLDLDWFIVRPSIIYGRGGASAALFQRLARLPVIGVVGDGGQPLQPVHIADVVATVRRCLTAARTRQTLDLAGNQTFGYVDWLQHLRLAQGLGPAPVLKMPIWLALAGAWLGQSFNPLLRPANIRMLLYSRTANSAAWQEFLGRKALDFRPALIAADALQAEANIRSAA
ncbi:MAG: NAD(P)H-binding protein [Rhodocyclaceae bacterium]|nr:NAD(P)H-binding protein [Rhodocyclaceae bacterium]MBX3666934.1 NAD(P)H-binding protein [Rhodocyclaceae bacterium]